MYKYVQVCTSLYKSAQVCTSLHKSVPVCELKPARVQLRQHESIKKDSSGLNASLAKRSSFLDAFHLHFILFHIGAHLDSGLHGMITTIYYYAQARQVDYVALLLYLNITAAVL